MPGSDLSALGALMNRRNFLAIVGAVSAGGFLPRWSAARTSRTRLILLGTGGGPRPRASINPSAQVIVVDDVLYVVDCGDGVARQLVAAGLSPQRLRHVFITHHHSDHNADYGNLLLLSWISGMRTRVDTWGPPPIRDITRLFFEMSAADIDVRIADEGRVPLVPLVHAHELTGPGTVLHDERVKVSCTVVDHPKVPLSLAYRFDTPDRSIVISGDTNRSERLVELARGADVLVHEALYTPAIDALLAGVPDAAPIKQHIIASHTTVEDCARVASAAGVRTLVLSHLVPADDPRVTPRTWLDAARKYFSGEIIVGRDLLEI